MIPGLQQSAAGMMSQMEQHQVIAENLAASSVKGFRRTQGSFQSYLDPAIESVGDPSSETMDMSHTMWPPSIPKHQMALDFTLGALESDGMRNHIGISGEGFFVVEKPGAGNVYTRNGSFHVNDKGEMLTPDGWRVMGDGNSPIVLPKPSEVFSVSETGEVAQNGNVVATIRVVSFKEPAKVLQGIGGNYFTSEATPDEKPVDTTVRQGFLESSNVNTVQEMISLIQATRAYESNQKMLQAQDSALEQVLRLPTR